jgi:hypothetical protein
VRFSWRPVTTFPPDIGVEVSKGCALGTRLPKASYAVHVAVTLSPATTDVALSIVSTEATGPGVIVIEAPVGSPTPSEGKVHEAFTVPTRTAIVFWDMSVSTESWGTKTIWGVTSLGGVTTVPSSSTRRQETTIVSPAATDAGATVFADATGDAGAPDDDEVDDDPDEPLT